ncbi:rubrerythrin-like domain-containing protein [Halopiger xanaduensis]|uniref:DUF7129 domain-containing protein n=1 Tax=Halopiger xanaduensis (strain DSM 18323 / JCM 14033 / SH-6) TaxID=797210 RepID=F8D7W8_HALXS|nr:rubrerythrin-like domain-containing protein [Halopiger xanaduensis]AEH36699.1 hypothetical protein Halxa_2074 [Halopiger xanaduensis SH-6]
MFDATAGSETESTYECLRCGKLITASTHPGACPECGAGIQNRANSLE